MEISIIWFRRDLRLYDNAALFHGLLSASKSGFKVMPIFIFDKNILSTLTNKQDARVNFIYSSIQEMRTELKPLNSDIQAYFSTPEDVFSQLSKEYEIKAIFTNADYEPYAIQRDSKIKEWAQRHGIEYHSYKDQVIFDTNEVLKEDGKPYTVFTPYSKKWKSKLNDFYLKPYPVEEVKGNYLKFSAKDFPSLEMMGFGESPIKIPSKEAKTAILSHYDETRNFPGNEHGTSRLGIHLRFGTISIRELARKAKELNETYLNELIWRDFYHTILFHFPHIQNSSFKKDYDNIQWENNEDDFKHWCDGNTGYPIVDAGIRELNTTGYMHNRVRMIVASFLTKHLLIDWRWGERYFAEKLLDFDLAANNGGWQWAAGSGCDAAPYFRVFNPTLQTEKFDKDLKYIKKWVPEFQSFEYTKPIVEHKFARDRALRVYKEGLKG